MRKKLDSLEDLVRVNMSAESMKEMLAELYFVDADWHTGPARDELMQRALTMFRFVDRHGKTYSMDRLQKISQLEKKLANGKP